MAWRLSICKSNLPIFVSAYLRNFNSSSEKIGSVRDYLIQLNFCSETCIFSRKTEKIFQFETRCKMYLFLENIYADTRGLNNYLRLVFIDSLLGRLAGLGLVGRGGGAGVKYDGGI